MSKNKLARLLFALVTCVALAIVVFASAACKKNKQEEVVYYVVSFETGDGSSVASQQVESGKTASKPENPTYNGYTFVAWFTDEQCSDGNEYDFDTAVTGNLTLYAKWTDNSQNPPAHTHTKGEWVKTDPEQHYKLCTDTDCPNPTEKLDAAAHDTNGEDGACSVCGYKAAVNPPPVDPTDKEFTVTFNAGEGATWSDSKLQAQLVENGKTATRPDDPVKNGFKLESWLLNGEVYNFSTPVTGNITLTAKWVADFSQVTMYEVTFVTGEGASSVPAQEIKAGDKAVEPQAPTMNDGSKVFDGWLLGGEVYDFNTPVTGNITLTAKWKEPTPVVQKYTVTFNPEGGSNVPAQLIVNGEKATEPTAPEKDGFTFDFWYLEGTETAYDFDTPVTGDITLKAKWTPNEGTTVFTVTFIDGETTVDTFRVAEGDTIETIPTRTKDGYTFDGWYNGTDKLEADTVITADVTYTAKWTKVETPAHEHTLSAWVNTDPAGHYKTCTAVDCPEVTGTKLEFAAHDTDGEDGACSVCGYKAEPVPVTYTVTFDVGEYNVTAPAAQTVNENETAEEPTALTLDGYTFLGWFEEDATAAFDFTTEITSNLTLYARFEAIHYDDVIVNIGDITDSTVADGTAIGNGVKAVGALSVEANIKSFVFNGQTISENTKRLKLNSSNSKYLQIDTQANAKILIYAYSGTDGTEVTMRLMNASDKSILQQQALGCGGVIYGVNGTNNVTVGNMGVVMFEVGKGSYLINGNNSANVYYVAVIYNEFNETTEHVDAVAAGCTTPGNIEHYVSNYGRYFAADGTTVITASSIVTLPVGHDYIMDEESLNLPDASTEGSATLVCRTDSTHDTLEIILPALSDDGYTTDSESKEGVIIYSFEYTYDYIKDKNGKVIATKQISISFDVSASAIEYVTVTVNDENNDELVVLNDVLKGGTVTAALLTQKLEEADKIPENQRVAGYYLNDGTTEFPFDDELIENTVIVVKFEDMPNEKTIGFNSSNVSGLTKEDLTTKSYDGIINLNVSHSSADVKNLGNLGNGIYYGGSASYIEIDLTNVTGDVKVKVEMAHGGSSARYAYLTETNSGNDISKAISPDAVAGDAAKNTIYSFEVMVQGGKKYYVRQKDTIYIYGVEVTYTP